MCARWPGDLFWLCRLLACACPYAAAEFAAGGVALRLLGAFMGTLVGGGGGVAHSHWGIDLLSIRKLWGWVMCTSWQAWGQ